jgi:SAM-dependent methyltransferase
MRTKPYHQTGKKMLEVLGFAKNYNAWIASKILSCIETPALEIGAGTGNITGVIIKSKTPVHVTESDDALVTLLEKRFSNVKNISVYGLDIEKNTGTVKKKYFASVYAVNVLEHIRDDRKALVHMRAMLRPGGKVVLFVPAKKFAFTGLDRQLGHFRRYEKQELADMLTGIGFTVESIGFFNIVGLLSWFIRGAVDADHSRLKPYQIRVFEGIIPVLKCIENMIPVPVGISLVAVGRTR